jgi:hypothetical protein
MSSQKTTDDPVMETRAEERRRLWRAFWRGFFDGLAAPGMAVLWMIKRARR